MNSILLGGAGMVTPVGVGVEAVNAAVRAGINSYAQIDLIGHDDDPIRMSLVPQMALDAVEIESFDNRFDARQRRMLRLAVTALENIKPCLPDIAIPLFLAGPEPYVSMSNVNPLFLESLANHSGVNIDLRQCRTINVGRAGGLHMIDMAFKYFSSTNAHYALVGGVDSFHDLLVLSYLDETNRLLKNDALDGFVPGEGAGFLLLISPDAPEELRQQATASILCPAMTHEEGHLLSESAIGGGLTNAFAQAMSKTQQPVQRIYSSENGERYYAKELSLALMRNQHSHKGQYSVSRPAEYFGDLGAAFGLVALGLASVNLHAKDRAATLVYCSSDSGERAALCMEPLVKVKTEKKQPRPFLYQDEMA